MIAFKSRESSQPNRGRQTPHRRHFGLLQNEGSSRRGRKGNARQLSATAVEINVALLLRCNWPVYNLPTEIYTVNRRYIMQCVCLIMEYDVRRLYLPYY